MLWKSAFAMEENRTFAEIGVDDFSRRFSLRTQKLMWMFGAGTSASAGIPTAEDMTWDFKQSLYISQKKGSPRAVADLANPVVRDLLQRYIDAAGNLPSIGDPEEYAALFEAAFPTEKDRQSYIDSKVSGGSPSYGHIAMAALMKAGLMRLVWTTNFDPLIADACARVYGRTGALTTVTLDAPDLARTRIADEAWPIEVKLHGDFRSRRLKNTTDELRQQDSTLRVTLIDACMRFGLIVIGYSGRDESIMQTLVRAATQKGAFPQGLFWLHRGDLPPLPRVQHLLQEATDRGVEAALVRVENFDETMRDLVRIVHGVDTSPLDAFSAGRRRWSAAPRPTGRQNWPVIRLNALAVKEMPTVCRLVSCEIGGWADVRDAVKAAGVDVAVARVRAGVLAFGADSDVRAAFEAYGVTEFDVHPLEVWRIRNESAERGLLREALSRALSRHRDLDVVHRRTSDLLVPKDPEQSQWAQLRGLVGPLYGTVAKYPDLIWREGCSVRLDWADDRMWLLFEPRTVFEGLGDENRTGAADFARERTVKRYNKKVNDLIEFWARLLAGDGEELRAFGCSAGLDAAFKLSPEIGYSWRVGA